MPSWARPECTKWPTRLGPESLVTPPRPLPPYRGARAPKWSVELRVGKRGGQVDVREREGALVRKPQDDTEVQLKAGEWKGANLRWVKFDILESS